MKKMMLSIALFLATTGASIANECIDLWIERNSIFNRAGYCFSSSLGKGYFNNSDCYTKNPQISSRENSRVATIKKREEALGCAARKKSWRLSDLRSRTKPKVARVATAPSVTSLKVGKNVTICHYDIQSYRQKEAGQKMNFAACAAKITSVVESPNVGVKYLSSNSQNCPPADTFRRMSNIFVFGSDVIREKRCDLYKTMGKYCVIDLRVGTGLATDIIDRCASR